MDSKCRETNARFGSSFLMFFFVFYFFFFYKDVSTIIDSSFLILTELMTLLQLICDPVKWVISIILHNWCLADVQNTNLELNATTLIFWINYANEGQLISALTTYDVYN